MSDTAATAVQTNDPAFANVFDELEWRGLVHVSTDRDALRETLAGSPITYYCGFDPTAPSLHLGNLVQLLTMRRLQLAGHRPLGLVGGATGLIGDPKQTAERVLNDAETVAGWVAKLRAQVERFLSFEGDSAARMVNNLDWTGSLSAIDFLREIGKHFRVGTMIKKETVATRLNSDAGISYTEFSYQILQGMDYLRLHENYDCVLQTGGSDQWGNLTSGTDLVHKVTGRSVHAFGTPLITDENGKKFGKSEGNAIWLDAEMCSPYAMYQFWLNVDDAIVVNLMKVFTFLTRDEIAEYERAVEEEGFRRAAQKRLALEVTTLVHGDAATRAAIDASEALFGRGDLAALDAETLSSALRELPHAELSPGTTVIEALVTTELVKSTSEARRAIQQGGVTVDGEKVLADDAVVGGSLAGGASVLRRGKKALAGIFLVG